MSGRVIEQVRLIGALRGNELDIEWRRVMRSPPLKLSVDLKRRAIAYRLQEKATGGLPVSVAKRLKAIVAGGKGLGQPKLAGTPKPGTRFVREWNQRTIVVTVIDDGFEFDGQIYSSLSKIAFEVTGTRWSGPRFFGLTND